MSDNSLQLFLCQRVLVGALGTVALIAGPALSPARADPSWFNAVRLGGTPPAEVHATTGVGGGNFNLNSFLGADRYYAAGITGQSTITFNVEAGHFWNGHETLQHVATNTTNFVNAADTFGAGAIAPLYDRHATWVASLIGGRQTASNPGIWQQGIAYGTDLRSAAIATEFLYPFRGRDTLSRACQPDRS